MTRRITSSGFAGVLPTVLSPTSVLAQSTTTKKQQSSPTFQYSFQFATDEPLACIGFTHMLTALLKLRFLAAIPEPWSWTDSERGPAAAINLAAVNLQ